MSSRLSLTAMCMLAGSLAQAAILVTSEGPDGPSQQYFGDGSFVLLEAGRPAFGLDRAGNCWFVQRDRLVADSCDRMLDGVDRMREKALTGIGQRERAMMQQMMGDRPGTAAAVQPAGSRTIAGYTSSCYRVGDTREVCVSERLLDEIQREMGNGRFADTLQRVQDLASGPGGGDAAGLRQLFAQGYPVSDRQTATSIPGIDPAMLKFIPEAQRAQVMQQMGMVGAGGQMQGTEVVRVDARARMPEVDFSPYRRMTFEQFMAQSMGAMPGMPGR